MRNAIVKKPKYKPRPSAEKSEGLKNAAKLAEQGDWAGFIDWLLRWGLYDESLTEYGRDRGICVLENNTQLGLTMIEVYAREQGIRLDNHNQEVCNEKIEK
jgi:hypothetical protein